MADTTTVAEDVAAMRVQLTDLATAASTLLETATTILDYVARPLANYVALRAYTGDTLTVRITTSGIDGPWTCDLTDTTSADNNGTIVVGADGRRWKRTYTGPVQSSWFETGTFTDSQAVTAACALAAGVVELTPRKTYAFTSPVPLIQHTTLSNPGRAKITYTGAAAFQLASFVTLNHMAFSGPVNTSALTAVGAVNYVTIKDPSCDTCSLVYCNVDSSVTYGAMDWSGKTTIAQYWNILNPQGTGVGAGSTSPFMDLRYFNDFNVDGGRATGYNAGIQYWGGDANFARDTQTFYTRMVDNFYVDGFVADDCLDSGLGGLMGQTVTFVGCSAKRTALGGSTGINHQGTLNAANIGCTATNYAGGNYGCYFGTKKMSLVDCSSYQKAGSPHFRNYNPDGLSVSLLAAMQVSGGRYVNTDGPGTALATFDDASGSFASFSMSGATLVDSGLNFTATQSGSVNIQARFQLTASPSSAIALIQLGVGPVGVETYRIHDCELSMPVGLTFVSGSTFVTATSKASTANVQLRIENNSVPYLPIQLVEQSTNSSFSGVAHVTGNTVSGVSRSNAGLKSMVIARSDNNYDVNGTLLTLQ